MARTKCICRSTIVHRNNRKLCRGRTLDGMICTCLLYDFGNFKLKSSPEFEFMQTQTNDAGERINPQTCQLIVAEFRKWMAMISYLVLKVNINENCIKTYHVINNEKIFVTTLDMPLYVERFLKYLMVNHHDHFKNLCQSLAGGYIARNGYMNYTHSNKGEDKAIMYNLNTLHKSAYR